MTRALLSAAVMIGLSCPAVATEIWLSVSGSIAPGSLPPADPAAVETIFHAPADSSGSLFIWARPDAGKKLQNWSLRLLASNPDVLSFTSSAVEAYNPVLGYTGSQDIVRWERVGEPAGDPAGPAAMIGDLQGFSLLQDTRMGMGIGPVCGGSDPFCDASKGVWLLAQIDYTLNGNLGQTELFLQIGDGGINNLGEESKDASVVFGALTDAALNGNDDRMISSATADALLWIANADMDVDGDTDGQDFLTWQRGFGIASGAQGWQGDATGEGAVDGLDLAAWQSLFGGGPGGTGSSSSVSVPEPSTWSLITMALAGLLSLVHVTHLDRSHPAPRRKFAGLGWA